jgi:hypothetical protein
MNLTLDDLQLFIDYAHAEIQSCDDPIVAVVMDRLDAAVQRVKAVKEEETLCHNCRFQPRVACSPYCSFCVVDLT